MSLAKALAGAETSLRPEIAVSWRRSRLHGVSPDLSPGTISIADVDSHSRLMTAGRPVLDELTGQLEGTRFCVLLADRDCRIVYRWFGDRHLQRQIEGIGAVLGSQFGEGRIGTNALGTPFELRQALEIHGGEHFVEALKRFSCYGHPIRHPLTGRIEGVLDITGTSDSGNPLFGPLVSRAVADVEQLLVEGARVFERRLFLAFQQATQHRSVPVAVLGGDVVFANKSCIEALRPADPTLLRALLSGVSERGVLKTALPLGDGTSVAVTAERVEGCPDGAVFQVTKCDHAGPRPGRPKTGGSAAHCRTVLITGEPGSGRSTEAAAVSGTDELVVLDAASALTQEPRQWAARFAELAAMPGTTLVLDDVHLFPESLLMLVRDALEGGRPARLALTACPADRLPPAVAAAAEHCARTIECKPLRARLDDLPALVEAMMAEERPEWQARFTGSALAALGAQPWPGNLRELRAVVRDIAQRPCTGVVDVAQLPSAYRASVKTRRLGGRELAERNAIISALHTSDGNKLRAARELGISRTTLYRRMQALEITDECPVL